MISVVYIKIRRTDGRSDRQHTMALPAHATAWRGWKPTAIIYNTVNNSSYWYAL